MYTLSIISKQPESEIDPTLVVTVAFMNGETEVERKEFRYSPNSTEGEIQRDLDSIIAAYNQEHAA